MLPSELPALLAGIDPGSITTEDHMLLWNTDLNRIHFSQDLRLSRWASGNQKGLKGKRRGIGRGMVL